MGRQADQFLDLFDWNDFRWVECIRRNTAFDQVEEVHGHGLISFCRQRRQMTLTSTICSGSGIGLTAECREIKLSPSLEDENMQSRQHIIHQ
ncbi:hypothetical protein D3C87_1666790 [compost metagenome]